MDTTQLTDTERLYVEARSQVPTKAEAFRQAGITHAAYYKWPKERQEYLETLVREYKANLSRRVLEILENSAEDAARVKAKGLKSQKDHIAQAAADSILDRILGRAKQPIEQSGDVTVHVQLKEVDDWRAGDNGKQTNNL